MLTRRLGVSVSGVSVLAQFVRLVGPERSVEVFGVRLVGVNAENGRKLLLSVAVVVAMLLVTRGLRALARRATTGADKRFAFWARQAVSIITALLTLVVLVSIWFSDPTRLATFLGLVTAGVAFAMQRVVTAFAGYVIILRGRTFNVGDRITMGGVRGDVIALHFMQTTIMEMGQPPGVNEQTDPAMWVKARQYTGRIVTVTNDKVFDTPVYNYTQEFPYLWEEMTVPIAYRDDRARAEQILLDAAKRHTIDVSALGEEAIREMERRYVMRRSEIAPRVYWRMTDNWLELTVRFLCKDHGVRDVKDAMSRQVLAALDEAKIGIASATFEVVGLPPLRLERATRARP
jgi:small-conductance mechanosensitive channel